MGLTGIEQRTLDLGAGNDTVTISGGQGTILGNTGDDSVTVSAVATAGLTVDGGEGSDTTGVTFGNLIGPLAIADGGGVGSDAVLIDCSLGAFIGASAVTLASETFTYTGIELAPCAPPPPPPPPKKPKCTQTGTKGNDVLRGTKKRDVLCGKGGNDILIGLGATIC